jgi:hypothetical protein
MVALLGSLGAQIRPLELRNYLGYKVSHDHEHASFQVLPAPVSDVARSKLLLTRKDAAASLSMSLDHFERHVQPHLLLVRSGALRLIPAAELERWVDLSLSGVGQ